MANEIKVNVSELVNTAVRNVGTATKSLDTTKVKKVPLQSSCNGIMLSQFISTAYEISALLKAFSDLVEKDMNDIEAAARTIKATDTKVAKDYIRL